MKGLGLIAGVLIVLLIFGGIGLYLNATGTAPWQAAPREGVGPTPGIDNCPDTLLTALKLQNFNMLNLSGTTAEGFDMTMICTGSDGITYTITDTTSPSATSVNCGVDYVCKGTSSSGAGGDHGKLVAVKLREGSTNPMNARIENGVLKFRASMPSVNIDIDGTQHGRVEARLYDKDAAGWVYSDNNTAANTWISMGTECNGAAPDNATCTFGSTTANRSHTTPGSIAVGSGGKLNLRMDIRVTGQQDEQLEDFGWYLFLEAPTATWDVPDIEVDGITRTSVCNQLNSDEAKKYSGEEYCYHITNVPITNNNEASIDMVYNALSGVNPSTEHINVTIVGIGAYRSTNDESVVKIGAVKDDSSQTVVLNIEEWRITIS